MKLNLRVVSVAVAVALGMLGAVLIVNPADLGISPVQARWLSIIAVGLGILQGFLPRVQGMTTDPATLVNHVSTLPAEDRAAIGQELARRDDMVVLQKDDAVRLAAEVPPIHPDLTPGQTDQLLTLIHMVGPLRAIRALNDEQYRDPRREDAP